MTTTPGVFQTRNARTGRKRKSARCDKCPRRQLIRNMRRYWCGHRFCNNCKGKTHCPTFGCLASIYTQARKRCMRCCKAFDKGCDPFRCGHLLCPKCADVTRECEVLGCNGLLLAPPSSACPKPNSFADYKEKFRVVAGTNVLAIPCKCPLCLPVTDFMIVYASTLRQHLLDDHRIAKHVVENYFGL